MSLLGSIACPPTMTVSPAANPLEAAIDKTAAAKTHFPFMTGLLKRQRVIALL
jgi:hypothetical protein